MVRVKGSDLKNANALAKLIYKSRPPVRTRGRQPLSTPSAVPRVDIVDDRLCDDVIKYLSPTLQKHKGCTLIDLQPGACLFSSKLHDFLKPKCHLLMEPESHYYEPFIKPLLHRPQSTYRYAPLQILHQSSYGGEFERILQDPNLLPSRTPLSADDPGRRKLDPSVLIVGNLSRETPERSQSHNVEQAALLLRGFGYSALANTYLQSRGLFRMLLWVPEIHKPEIHPVLPWMRSAFNIGLDLGFSISDAVSVQSVDSIFQGRLSAYARRSRPSILDHAAAKEIAQNTQELGMSVPAGRELETLDPSAAKQSDSPVRLLSPLRTSGATVPKLRQKIDRLHKRLEDVGPYIRAKMFRDTNISRNLQYPQVSPIIDEYGKRFPSNVRWFRVKVLLDMMLQLVNIEAQFKELEERNPKREELEDLRKAVLELDEELGDIYKNAALKSRIACADLLDDQIAFFSSPRLLNIWQRAYEPLKASPSDFWPKKDLALLDMTPKARDLSVPGLASREEATRVASEMVSILLSSKSKSVPDALENMGVNAAKDLIPMVPAITDTRKGGRMNPHRLRVTMLTDEMIEGLVKAFFEWPFRPQSWELALAERTAGPPHESETGESVAEESEER